MVVAYFKEAAGVSDTKQFPTFTAQLFSHLKSVKVMPYLVCFSPLYCAILQPAFCWETEELCPYVLFKAAIILSHLYAQLMTDPSVCAFHSVVFIPCISTSLSVSEWESNGLRLLLSEQCDSVQVCAGLPGNADCECSPRGLLFFLVSDKHFRTPHARRPLKGIRLEAQTSAFLNITTLLFLLWGNAITKWAKFQLACVIHPNRHYPSLFAPKLICGDVISHITVTIYPC